MKRVVSLRWLASRKGPLTAKQLQQVQDWLDADWESHDIDRDAIALIRRLVDTAQLNKLKLR